MTHALMSTITLMVFTSWTAICMALAAASQPQLERLERCCYAGLIMTIGTLANITIHYVYMYGLPQPCK